MRTEVSPELYAQLLHLGATYALGVDTGNAAQVSGCFTADADLSVGGQVVTSTAEGIATRLTSRADPAVLHTSTGLVARHRADGAVEAASYFFMFDTRTGQVTASGRYDDVAVLTDDGPRWSSRAVTYTWRLQPPAETSGR